MPPEVVRVTVELSLSGERIAGRVLGDDGEQPFVGWLALLSVLEGAVGRLRETEIGPGEIAG